MVIPRYLRKAELISFEVGIDTIRQSCGNVAICGQMAVFFPPQSEVAAEPVDRSFNPVDIKE